MLSENIPAVAGHRRPEIDHDRGRKITARSIKTHFELNGTVKTICPQPWSLSGSNRQQPVFIEIIEQQVEWSMRAQFGIEEWEKDTPRYRFLKKKNP